MWSNENRARYDRGKMRYPSDVTDEEWALVAFCPSAGSSNAPSPGSAAAAGWPRIGNASIARRSPSSASPPSASCCESYAIPHNLPGQTLTKKNQADLIGSATEILLSREAYHPATLGEMYDPDRTAG